MKKKFDEKNSIEISLTSTSDDCISTRISREIFNMKDIKSEQKRIQKIT